MSVDVIIVGAGISGLVCGQLLEREGISSLILDAADDVGGRVRTDEHEGFLMDRGFQVLLTAYPETKSVLDYESLNLCAFEPGALVHFDGKMHLVSDPLRDPRAGVITLFSPVGSLIDKMRLGKLKAELALKPTERLIARRSAHRTDETTREWLEDYGFGEEIITRFLKPFFAGVFLEDGLQTASSFCQFVFKMFSEGPTCVPEAGMGQLSRQLASRLPASSFRLGAKVERVESQGVVLSSGETIRARYVVVATDRAEAERFLDGALDQTIPWRSCCTLYFAAPEPPEERPILMLNGEGKGIINHAAVMTQVSPRYSSTGEALIAATTVGVQFHQDADLIFAARKQLREWFGSQVDQWRLIKLYRVPHALPSYEPFNQVGRGPSFLPDWLKVCGDHLETPSIESAVRTGKKAALEIIAALQSQRRAKIIPFRRAAS